MRAVAQLLLVLLYPGVVYLCLERGGVRLAAAAVLVLLAARFGLASPAGRRALPAEAWAGLALAAALGAGAAVIDRPLPLLLLPVGTSAIGLFVFGVSLRRVPLVEQLARRERSELSPPEVRYCRNVTRVWCGFFAVNGLLSLALALRAPLAVWALYTGLVSYLAIAALFVGEWIVRHVRFGADAGTPLEAWLRRVGAGRLR